MQTTMTHKRQRRPKLSGIRQQFHISAEAEESLADLAEQLGKTSANNVKREILEACKGLAPNHYYMALGELQKLANK